MPLMVNIDDLSGRDLDALVASRIMGWRIDTNSKAPDGSPMAMVEVPRYSGSAPMARGIQFKLEQCHPGASMRCESESPFTFVMRGPSGREYTAVDNDEATAICRVILKTMDGEGPGIPRDQIQPDRSPRAISAIAEMMAAKAHPHQAVGILAQAAALKHGDTKDGAANALLQYAATAPGIIPILAEHASSAGRVGQMCIAALNSLVQAGEAARSALARLHP